MTASGGPQLATAILAALDGDYPTDETVFSCTLDGVSLTHIVNTLQDASERLKLDIEQRSQQSSSTVTAWAERAQNIQMGQDVFKIRTEKIKVIAQEVKELEKLSKDVMSKRDFLLTEIEFSSSLLSVLTRLDEIQNVFREVEESVAGGELDLAVSRLESAELELTQLAGFEEIVVVGLLKERARALRAALVETVEECWQAMVEIDVDNKLLRINQSIQVSGDVSPSVVVQAMENLNVLSSKISNLHHTIDKVLIIPRMQSDLVNRPHRFIVDQSADSFQISYEPGNLHLLERDIAPDTLEAFLADTLRLLAFIADRLPSSIVTPLFRRVSDSIISQLLEFYLPRTIPASLDGLSAFDKILHEISEFSMILNRRAWTLNGDLQDWVDRAAKVWLTKRREIALHDSRKAIARGIGESKLVERIVTPNTEDLGALWDEDYLHEEKQTTTANRDDLQHVESQRLISTSSTSLSDDENEADGWGLDDEPFEDDSEEKHAANKAKQSDRDDEENADEAWGWGDDDEVEAGGTLVGEARNKEAQGITLKETYLVSSIPSAILVLIRELFHEAQQLRSNGASYRSVAPAAQGLLSIPSLILANYRALSVIHYPNDDSLRMRIYNDSLYLSEALPNLETELFSSSGTSIFPRFSVTGDVSSLESFGKRQYGKEMETEHLILRDLLDGAQGLAHSNRSPMKEACDSAIAAVVDRISRLDKTWRTILSLSVHLQAIGALLSTVITKLITDITDMTDISVEESESLARLCSQVTELQSLFDGQPGGPALYTINWLKFGHLENILNCTMTDLLDNYNAGLLIDFEKQELIDLVKALFDNNDRRRKLIEVIRRGPNSGIS